MRPKTFLTGYVNIDEVLLALLTSKGHHSVGLLEYNAAFKSHKGRAKVSGRARESERYNATARTRLEALKPYVFLTIALQGSIVCV